MTQKIKKFKVSLKKSRTIIKLLDGINHSMIKLLLIIITAIIVLDKFKWKQVTLSHYLKISKNILFISITYFFSVLTRISIFSAVISILRCVNPRHPAKKIKEDNIELDEITRWEREEHDTN